VRNLVPGILLIFLLTACAGPRGKLDENVKQYNDLIKVQRLGEASRFSSADLARDFGARAMAIPAIKVVDYRIVNVIYDDAAATAEVTVAIEYYSLSSYRAVTVTDVQKWAYREDRWVLTSLLPEFK
jgi:hypothetical protein